MYTGGLKERKNYERSLRKRRHVRKILLSGSICIWFAVCIFLGYKVLLYALDLGFIDCGSAYEENIDAAEWVSVQTEPVAEENMQLASDAVVPDAVVPEAVVPEDVVPDAVVPDDVSPDIVSPDVLAESVDDTDVVIIDPGHGGEDSGCGHETVLEKEINLQLALSLQARLEEMGYEVILTRNEDTYLTLEERVALANASKADIYISIHQNASEDKAVDGIETWYCSVSNAESSERLANLLQQNVVKETEAVDRGFFQTDEFKVIREIEIPACLIETGFLSNPDEGVLLADEEYQAKIVEGLAEGIELYFSPKTMYLTFDDGPTAENTDLILDILKENNIKATFFVVGENVRKHPEVAKRIAEEGHTIGIHCDNHAYNTLYESVDSFLADFEAAYETVYEVTGVEAKLFRFPGGSVNAYNKEVYEEIIIEMTNRGFVYFDWNASLGDAAKKTTPEQLLKNAKDTTLGRRKVVMLAHDTVYDTAECLQKLIDQFPEYKMEPLTVDVEPIQF